MSRRHRRLIREQFRPLRWHNHFMSVTLPIPTRLHRKPIKDYFNKLMSVVAPGVEAETEKRMKMMTLFGEVDVDKDGYGWSPLWKELSEHFEKKS